MEQNQKIIPHMYDQLIFDKGAKNIHWRKDSLFHKLYSGGGGGRVFTCRRINLDDYLIIIN